MFELALFHCDKARPTDDDEGDNENEGNDDDDKEGGDGEVSRAPRRPAAPETRGRDEIWKPRTPAGRRRGRDFRERVQDGPDDRDGQVPVARRRVPPRQAGQGRGLRPGQAEERDHGQHPRQTWETLWETQVVATDMRKPTGARDMFADIFSIKMGLIGKRQNL